MDYEFVAHLMRAKKKRDELHDLDDVSMSCRKCGMRYADIVRSANEPCRGKQKSFDELLGAGRNLFGSDSEFEQFVKDTGGNHGESESAAGRGAGEQAGNGQAGDVPQPGGEQHHAP